MEKLKYSELHPLKPNLINEQLLTKDEFINKFNNFQWVELLELQLSAKELYGSPSLNIENEKGDGIAVSIVGNLHEYEFYVCYKRPTTYKKSKWFGLVTYDFYDKDFCSVIPGQTKEDAFEAFMLFYEKDYEKIEEKWG